MLERNLESIFRSPESEKQYLAAYEAVLSLWPVPAEPMDIRTSFGLTHVNACGSRDNPAMVLLPGFGANSTMWFPNVGVLSSRYRIYALDTPGQPGRSVPGLRLAASNSAAWIQEVFNELGLEKAGLMGVSLGGWLALDFAIRIPELTERVILLDPAASFAKMSITFLLHSFLPIMLHPTRPGLIRYFRWMTQGYVVNPAWGDLMLSGILNTRPQPPIRAVPFSDAQLRSIRTPTLVLIGGRSVIYNPESAARRAARTIPNAVVEIIPNASHALNAERFELVNSCILHFCCEDL